MHHTMSNAAIATFFIGLVSIYSPPSALAPCAAVTDGLPADVRRRIALRMFLYVSGGMVVLAWVGQFALEFLGVSVAGLTATGGLALIIAAEPMMRLGSTNAAAKAKRDEQEGDGPADWRSQMICPLLFPVSLGGASASLVIITARRFHTPLDLLIVSGVCVVYGVIVGLNTYFAHAIARCLGKGGMDILTRIGGIVLTAIAFHLLVEGISELVVATPAVADFLNGLSSPK